MGRTTAAGPRPTRSRISAELAALSNASSERSHPTARPRLVLHSNPCNGRDLLLCALPRPEPVAVRRRHRRPHLRIGLLRRNRLVAPDAQRSGLGAADFHVPVKNVPGDQCFNPLWRPKRRALWTRLRLGLAQRPPSGADVPIARRRVYLDRIRRARPLLETRRLRRNRNRLDVRNRSPATHSVARIRTPRQTMGKRTRTGHLEPASPILGSYDVFAAADERLRNRDPGPRRPD